MKVWIFIVATLVLTYPLFVVLRMVFVAQFQLYQKLKKEKEQLQAELDTIKQKETGASDVFDLSARDAAGYVMKHLEKDINQVTEFLKQMAIEGRVHIRAVKNGHSTDSPVAPEIFQENKLHLVADENERRQAEHFGCAFHDDGWIDKKNTRELNDPLLYQAPRFLLKEIEEVVNWYKKSRPNNHKE